MASAHPDSPSLNRLRLSGTGNRGPLLVLGGVLLCAGLILHFDRAGNSRNSVTENFVANDGGAASGEDAAGSARKGYAGSDTDGPSKGTGRNFLRSPEYKAALEVAGMADNSMRTEALEALIETWVAISPVDAADWAGSLPSGDFRDDAMSSLMFHWGQASPAEAAAWMARTGVDDPEAASTLACRWAATDPSSAASWATGLKDSEMRVTAIAGIAGAWAERSPAAAADWVSHLPQAEKESAAATLTAAWSATEPAAAAAWLARQADANQETQTTALAVLAANWGEQSPGAASRFLNSLPEGAVRDAAASQFAIAAAPAAPAEALAWAMNLPDPEERNQVVTSATENWYDGAPEGFRAGISDALSMMDDPSMRKGVYEMLYERDPGFHDNLLKLVEPAAPAAAPVAPVAPAAVPSQPYTPAPAASPAAPVAANSFSPEVLAAAVAAATAAEAAPTDVPEPASERPTVSPLIPGSSTGAPAFINGQPAPLQPEVQSGNLLPTSVTIKRPGNSIRNNPAN